MRIVGVLLLPLTLLAAPATADAAVVDGVESTPESREFDGVVTVTDEHDVRNRLQIDARPGSVRVREDGPEPLEARGSCRLEAPKRAVCAVGHVTVRAAGGDDVVVLREGQYEGIFLVAHGGEGSDLLRATDEGAELRGGAGADVLSGGVGPNHLVGGAGRDRLIGGPSGNSFIGDGPADPPAADVIVGGRGRDFASWSGRRRPVRVDLRSRRPQGSRGEGDRLRSIESVAGGAGDDDLRGTDEKNHIYGGRGADRLHGFAGNDLVDAGTDTSGAGSGENDRAVDRLSCGDGTDRVIDGYREVFPRSCEQLDFNDSDVLEAATQVLQPRLRRGRLFFHTTECGCAATSYRRVRVLFRGREIGRSRYAKQRDRGTWIPVRMRRPLPRRGIVRIVIAGVDPVGNREDPNGPLVYEPFRFSYRLRR